MKIAPAFALCLALAGCGGTGPKPDNFGAKELVRLDKDGPQDLAGGKLQVVSHRCENRDGVVQFAVDVRNAAREAVTARLYFRFFDRTYSKEFEKSPAIYDVSLKAGENRLLEGTLNFHGLPEGDGVAMMGICVLSTGQ